METQSLNFYNLALDFCIFVEKQGISKDTLRDTAHYLSALYNAALAINYKAGGHLKTSEINRKPRLNLAKIHISDEIKSNYYKVFNPFVDETVACSLSDDICDIYKDLQEGIEIYELGDHSTAAYIWGFYFENHWGRHCLGALAALHQILYELEWES